MSIIIWLGLRACLPLERNCSLSKLGPHRLFDRRSCFFSRSSFVCEGQFPSTIWPIISIVLYSGDAWSNLAPLSRNVACRSFSSILFSFNSRFLSFFKTSSTYMSKTAQLGTICHAPILPEEILQMLREFDWLAQLHCLYGKTAEEAQRLILHQNYLLCLWYVLYTNQNCRLPRGRVNHGAQF